MNVASGAEIARVTHDDVIDAVAISPDGNRLATGSRDETAAVWVIEPQDITSEACTRLTRNLTVEEWRQYVGEEPYQKTCPDLT